MKLEFSSMKFGKILKIKLTKIRTVGAGWFYAERHTVLVKLIAVFLNFAKAPKLIRSVAYLVILH
jgi:hypothetical protein